MVKLFVKMFGTHKPLWCHLHFISHFLLMYVLTKTLFKTALVCG